MSVPPLTGPVPRRSAWRRWPKWFALLAVLIWLTGFGVTLLIRHSRLQRRITARLESAFGRPVEVGSYGFSLWGWPTLQAQSVTVAEDTRFGYEYFLRADSLTMRLRWRGLLRGRLEFGTFSLERPSLNLVRDASGDWNLAEWLPHPSTAASPAGAPPVGPPAPAPSPLRFTRIEVDGGRINFKRGSEKIPFAFTGVSGYVEPDGAGRWRLDLEAVPMRAAVNLQQAGTLHLSGLVGGTSSRLRPAALDLSWSDASISDVLRLARSYDYGVRGKAGLSLHAETAEYGWHADVRTELRQLHRWDLPLRDDDPAVNLTGKLNWLTRISGLELENATLESPHSHVNIRASMSWNVRHSPRAESAYPFVVRVDSSAIDAGDLLSWLRAFHSGVADDVTARGTAKLDGVLHGWPWGIEQATLDLDDGELSGPRLPAPVRLHKTRIHYDQHGISHTSIALFFGEADRPSSGFIIVDGGTSEQAIKGASNLRLAGRIRQVRDVITTAGALGWNISRGWDLGGSAAFEFMWLGARYPWQAEPRGTVEWGGDPPGASLAAPFLNLPIEHIRAGYFVRGRAQAIDIRSADAFGAHWKGSVGHVSGGTEWQFALAADHLAAADLDRWLNPRWRQTFLDRLLPFLNSPPPPRVVPEYLHASGKISVDQFTLAPFAARRLQSDVQVAGRRIHLANARAQFYGGDLSGSFEASLNPLPAYRLAFDYSHVDLAALTSATPSLADLFSGSATGQISISARGANRTDLLASLECQGAARITSAELHNLTPKDSERESPWPPAWNSFRESSAAYTCADQKIQFQELTLLAPGTEIGGSGTVGFNRDIEFRLGVFSPPNVSRGPHPPRVPVEAFRVTGPLAAPAIVRATARPGQP